MIHCLQYQLTQLYNSHVFLNQALRRLLVACVQEDPIAIYKIRNIDHFERALWKAGHYEAQSREFLAARLPNSTPAQLLSPAPFEGSVTQILTFSILNYYILFMG